MMKVLIHVDHVENWKMALENTKNMLQYVEEHKESYQIEIVANGDSVNGLLKNDPVWKDTIESLAKKEVLIAACHNSLNKFQLKKSDLFDCVHVVPAGVIELILKQQKGFAYFKP